MPNIVYKGTQVKAYPAFVVSHCGVEIALKEGLNVVTDEQLKVLIELLEIDPNYPANEKAIFLPGEGAGETTNQSPPPAIVERQVTDIPDIENMSSADALKAIDQVMSIEVLELLTGLENAGKKRKTVLEAIATQVRQVMAGVA